MNGVLEHIRSETDRVMQTDDAEVPEQSGDLDEAVAVFVPFLVSMEAVVFLNFATVDDTDQDITHDQKCKRDQRH